MKPLQKQIPNTLSISRIILSIVLLFFLMEKPLFFILYAICGFTDILDGFIARKFSLQSKLGAKLDSVGDLFMFVAVIIFIKITYGFSTYLLIGGLIILIFRIINILISIIKHKKILFLHTIANKITGLALFLYPFALLLEISTVYEIVMLFFAMFSCFEDFLLLLRNIPPDLNVKSIFIKQK